jgi:hypothetical protein
VSVPLMRCSEQAARRVGRSGVGEGASRSVIVVPHTCVDQGDPRHPHEEQPSKLVEASASPQSAYLPPAVERDGGAEKGR